jgi:hypothetical protein
MTASASAQQMANGEWRMADGRCEPVATLGFRLSLLDM